MIAEAMRLSLVEEDDRQRKEREKEAKDAKDGKKPDDPDADAARPSTGAGPSTSARGASPAPPPGAASEPPAAITRDPSSGRASASPEPAPLLLPAITGSSLLPPPTADERGRAGHRPSSSISALQTPPASPGGAGDTARARSQPPYNALGAALRSAAPTAPGAGAEPADAPAGAAQGKGKAPERSPDLASTTSGASTPHARQSPPLPAAPPAAEPTPIPLPSPRPLALHTASFASSVFSNDSADDRAAYDVLSSSPDSDGESALGVAREPLLGGEAPVARQRAAGA